MCFSATASFTAGIGLSVIGGAAIARTTQKTDIPFATIPLLFGIQQLAEGVIWLSLGTSASALSMATFIYLLFSHVVWPILLPTSIFLMERTGWRRWALSVCMGIGAVVSVYFLYYLLVETVTASVIYGSIAYTSPHFFKIFIVSPYTIATCASCLFSSHRIINMFGIVAFIAAIIASMFYYYAFISVWCFFGAILSVIIYLQKRPSA